MEWLTSTLRGRDAGPGDALDDVSPLLLALLDFRSLQSLSSVSRDATVSAARRFVLERTAVQLSADSLRVHAMLRRMALRRYLHQVEIRDCWATPLAIPDLPQLLSGVKSVKVSREPMLDGEVDDRVDALLATRPDWDESRECFKRRVRRRLVKTGDRQHLDLISSSPRVADNISQWMQACPPSLVAMDLLDLKIDDLRWLVRFHGLRKLHFDASAKEPVETFLKPLAELPLTATLTELVIEQLQVSDCSELGGLGGLRKLELRGARRLVSLGFVSSLQKLETVVLTDMMLTNLTPLTNLPALRDVTLDSIGVRAVVELTTGVRAAVKIGVPETTVNTAWPVLEKLQLLFLRAPVARFLHHCPNLVHFHVCQTKFTQLTSLGAMEQLETVSMSVDGVKDWSPLARLPRLKRIAFDSKFGRIESKYFVKGWTSLQEIISPPWDDYSSLVENVPSLERLELLGWRLRDSSSLETLRDARRLVRLRIAFVPGAVDLSSLSDLKQLRKLELWSASVVSIGFLRGLENLAELHMPTPFGASASITEFSPLGTLTNLRTLVLSGRRELQDPHIALVMKLPKLKNLYVEGSGVSRPEKKKLQRHFNMEKPNLWTAGLPVTLR